MPERPDIVDCEGCGACCLHMGFPAYLTEESPSGPEPAWKNLPDDLRAEILESMEGYKPRITGLDGPCTWFDPETKSCRHHEHRPQVCRDFQIGSPECRDWRRVYNIS